KIHPFAMEPPERSYRASAPTIPAKRPRAVARTRTTPAMSTPYKLRFPELYRALSAAGAEALVVPAAFTVTTGKDHWHVLLRARAIEAQAYVIAAAQWGKHPRGRQTYGKSLVADPWGDVIAQASDGEGLIVTTLHRRDLDEVRSRLPALRHRRLP